MRFIFSKVVSVLIVVSIVGGSSINRKAIQKDVPIDKAFKKNVLLLNKLFSMTGLRISAHDDAIKYLAGREMKNYKANYRKILDAGDAGVMISILDTNLNSIKFCGENEMSFMTNINALLQPSEEWYKFNANRKSFCYNLHVEVATQMASKALGKQSEVVGESVALVASELVAKRRRQAARDDKIIEVEENHPMQMIKSQTTRVNSLKKLPDALVDGKLKEVAESIQSVAELVASRIKWNSDNSLSSNQLNELSDVLLFFKDNVLQSCQQINDRFGFMLRVVRTYKQHASSQSSETPSFVSDLTESEALVDACLALVDHDVAIQTEIMKLKVN